MALPGIYAALTLLGRVDDVQVQPAGVDLRVGEIHRFLSEGMLAPKRVLPETEPVEARDGFWFLEPGFYKVVFADAVYVPPSAVGICLPRSSLLRMGATLSCAVWDPGYMGRGEALLIVGNPHGIRIAVGERIAQMLYIRVEPPPASLYAGFYQGERLGTR
ncbi:deoxyuridine 5'-triphosphate nucleotidohydrolase [Hyperthermus butylicus]|uniref:Deoxycytidine deaminase n=1 Tax=Hyperthermus butylicus (strain DSM 5456 / JCM 9403 / PLM1-5) TaxID=415426 RepID=A2BL47_HYPBU|nr:deoxyuridine 5'-triphosphate nucleotidohydrolase [Hyperthermus butylicus]ABM80708.1 Deoxycytidine deaminase [Hyperthermus butylicus DSM 5456]